MKAASYERSSSSFVARVAVACRTASRDEVGEERGERGGRGTHLRLLVLGSPLVLRDVVGQLESAALQAEQRVERRASRR